MRCMSLIYVIHLLYLISYQSLPSTRCCRAAPKWPSHWTFRWPSDPPRARGAWWPAPEPWQLGCGLRGKYCMNTYYIYIKKL